jgi:hypothetical protein
VGFSFDDCEKAIVRIFDIEDNKIGTGFLVYPGYILTCSHIVLQALGLDFDEKNAPTEHIIIDFPVLAPEKKIEAVVIDDAWSPYSEEDGDIASLKLLSRVPDDVKPIPIDTAIDNINRKDRYFASSFAVSGGRLSDEYSYNGSSTGLRARFKKCNSSDADRIEEGFSGAPIWNATQDCVVGMLATSDGEDKVFAIPNKKLEEILQKLSTYRLCDIIHRNLNHIEVVKEAFSLCNFGNAWIENNTYRSAFLKLSNKYDSSNNSVDLLTKFAVFIAVIEATNSEIRETNKELLEELKIWVGNRGFNFYELFFSATNERRNKYLKVQQASNDVQLVEKQIDVTTTANNNYTPWFIGVGVVSFFILANIIGSSVTEVDPEISETQINSKSDPKTFLKNYFETANSGQLDQLRTTWNMLSPTLKKSNFDGNFREYLKMWQDKIELYGTPIIKDVDGTNTGNSARVYVDWKYCNKDKNLINHSIYFAELKWDCQENTWIWDGLNKGTKGFTDKELDIECY